MNVDLWLERFREHLKVRGRTPATVKSYLAESRRFLFFLVDRGITAPHQLGREEVEAYQVHVHRRRKTNGEPLALHSQHARMSAVLAFLRFLHEARFVVVDPGRDIALPRLPSKLLPELPSEDEVLRLLEAPDTSTPLGLRDRAVLEVLYSSALRNTELRLLRTGDVDLDRLEIRVLEGKGGKQRVVPLGEPAAAWVEEYLRHGRGFLLREKDHGRLFSSVRGEPLTVEALAEICKRHALVAGLTKRVTPHILRHCCATHMLARDARLRYLQELLGHTSAATTQRYTQVDISDLRAVHQRCHPRESF